MILIALGTVFRCFIAIATLYVIGTNTSINFPTNIIIGILSIIWILNPLIEKLKEKWKKQDDT